MWMIHSKLVHLYEKEYYHIFICEILFVFVLQIKKAKTICECLVASDGVDLKLEDAFCLFLLGQVVFSFIYIVYSEIATSKFFFYGHTDSYTLMFSRVMRLWLLKGFNNLSQI